MMRVLLDTNIVIGREDPKIPPQGLADLLRILNQNSVTLLVHPRSIEELEKDPDPERREQVLAKTKSYPQLEETRSPPARFLVELGNPILPNDVLDAEILYAVASNAVSFILTGDRKLIQRASRIGLQDRVLTVQGGLEYFSSMFARALPLAPLTLHNAAVHALDVNDSFFDSIKKDYPGFETWFRQIAQEGRRCIWLATDTSEIGALLIYKDETEQLLHLPTRRRLKLCTFKVAESLSRQRVSELLLSWAFQYAKSNGFAEAYVTIYPRYEVQISILEAFGFSNLGRRGGEIVLLKKLSYDDSSRPPPPAEFFKTYFPSYRRDSEVRKFLVPVRPHWHTRLFPEYHPHRVQKVFEDYTGAGPAGNAIRKTYLCNSRITKIRPGDILLFYRSSDIRKVTHIGIVEQAVACRSLEEVIRTTGNRTVLPIRELRSICRSPVLAILFWSAGPVSHEKPEGIPIRGVVHAPQSIIQIDESKYRKLCT